MDNKIRIIPSIGYQDAKKAIKWLCEAFDFSEDAVYETEDGKIRPSFGVMLTLVSQPVRQAGI